MPANLSAKDRLKIIKLHKQGLNFSEIERATGIHRSTVRRWVQRHSNEGNVMDRHRAGRPRALNEEQVTKIVHTYEEEPSTAARKFAEEFKVSPQTVRYAIQRAKQAKTKKDIKEKCPSKVKRVRKSRKDVPAAASTVDDSQKLAQKTQLPCSDNSKQQTLGTKFPSTPAVPYMQQQYFEPFQQQNKPEPWRNQPPSSTVAQYFPGPGQPNYYEQRQPQFYEQSHAYRVPETTQTNDSRLHTEAPKEQMKQPTTATPKPKQTPRKTNKKVVNADKWCQTVPKFVKEESIQTNVTVKTFNIQTNPSSQSVSTSGAEKPHQEPKNYICNECRKSIYGFRHACIQCRDYYVCEVCVANGAHPQHFVLRIPQGRTQLEIESVLQSVLRILQSECEYTFAEKTLEQPVVPQSRSTLSEPYDFDSRLQAAPELKSDVERNSWEHGAESVSKSMASTVERQNDYLPTKSHLKKYITKDVIIQDRIQNEVEHENEKQLHLLELRKSDFQMTGIYSAMNTTYLEVVRPDLNAEGGRVDVTSGHLNLDTSHLNVNRTFQSIEQAMGVTHEYDPPDKHYTNISNG